MRLSSFSDKPARSDSMARPFMPGGYKKPVQIPTETAPPSVADFQIIIANSIA